MGLSLEISFVTIYIGNSVVLILYLYERINSKMQTHHIIKIQLNIQRPENKTNKSKKTPVNTIRSSTLTTIKSKINGVKYITLVSNVIIFFSHF